VRTAGATISPSSDTVASFIFVMLGAFA